MKKLAAIFILSLLLCSNLLAQNRITDFFNRPTRKSLNQENERLKADLDSLQIILDSLHGIIAAAEEEELMESEDSSLFAEPEFEYTQELSDSLLHLWYQNTLNGDVELVNEYNMDSVKFTSNLSDAQMEKKLTDMNSFISLPFNDNVKNYIILYSEKRKEQMSRVMGLSEYYFPIFEEVFSRYGLPLELKYMAVIESMLNPVARSRVGAMGIWQFMYSTARQYGLEINSYVDERLDVERAVDAAARYLKDAYQIYGDWALAISSYNCGAGNVSKAIRRAGGARDFWSIYPFLPRETRGYVPAFVGAMYAMHYAPEYGIEPLEVGMPARTDTFHIRQNLHFKQISEVIGIPEKDLSNLNPQYLHNIVPGKSRPSVLKLPYIYTNEFLEIGVDSLYNYKRDTLLSEKVLKDVDARAGKSEDRIAYKVKSGDYLGKIASQYRVTVRQIQNWNNMKNTKLRVGQTLYIYRNGGPAKSSASSSKSNSSSSTKAATGSSASGSNGRTYTVKSGDSLYSIAKLYPGVSAANIKAANNLKSDNIKPGQKLVIPLP